MPANIHLVMSGVYNVLDHFPDRTFIQSNIASYSAALSNEMERVRDGMILHCCLNERSDRSRWNQRRRPSDFFTDRSGFHLHQSLRVETASDTPAVDVMSSASLRDMLATLARATAAAGSLSHDSRFAPAPNQAHAQTAKVATR
jgi:hypothetical protein